MKERKKIFLFSSNHLDAMSLVAVGIMILFGFLAIYSIALSQEETDLFFVKKQAIALFIGLFFSWILVRSNYRFLKGYNIVLYIVSLVLLLAVLIFGETIRGTRGWFVFGTISFQPVEFVKIGLIVFFADFFSGRVEQGIHLRDLLVSMGLLFIPLFLVFLQPDTGSALVIFFVWFSFLLFTGLSKRSLFFLAVLFCFVGIFAWYGLLAPYQKERIMTVFHPTEDPLGQGYNVSQALIAIGSGGWFGRGLGFGSQSQLQFLPESQTDFIFAVLAEEFGFFGVSILFLSFFFFFFQIGKTIFSLKDLFTQYLLFGIVSLFFVQFVVNIGMNLGLLPVTGIPLPFVSYGGSSLVASLLLLGIIQSIFRHISFQQKNE